MRVVEGCTVGGVLVRGAEETEVLARAKARLDRLD